MQTERVSAMITVQMNSEDKKRLIEALADGGYIEYEQYEFRYKLGDEYDVEVFYSDDFEDDLHYILDTITSL